jgi:hypothetical protein
VGPGRSPIWMVRRSAGIVGVPGAGAGLAPAAAAGSATGA